MRTNHISVASLAEHEPNNEFLGRNFNNGEVIELVLKSHSGRWLSFQFVQMVMMHELAHCKQMNHSKDFWAVRNQYCTELRALWAKGYVGEGLWGRGQPLSGQYSLDTPLPQDEIPEHLCGGGFRSRGRKRKRKEKVKKTYAEKKNARIQKKFGKAGEGVALGGDLATRGLLEKGKKVGYGTPRVAQSNRGRDLRAMAALARFEQAKNDAATPDGPTPSTPVADADDSETESESETDDEEDPDAKMKDAVDINGKKILDPKGRPMVRVCEDEDTCHDTDAQNEFAELGQVNTISPKKPSTTIIKRTKSAVSAFHIQERVTALLKAGGTDRNMSASHIQERIAALLKAGGLQTKLPPVASDGDDISTASEDDEEAFLKLSSRTSVSLSMNSLSENKFTSAEKPPTPPDSVRSDPSLQHKKGSPPPATNPQLKVAVAPSIIKDEPKMVMSPIGVSSTVTAPAEVIESTTALVCGVCSLENEIDALICIACSNVLDLERLPSYWCCKSIQCRGSVYVNHGDSGVCGLCGTKRQAIR